MAGEGTGGHRHWSAAAEPQSCLCPGCQVCQHSRSGLTGESDDHSVLVKQREADGIGPDDPIKRGRDIQRAECRLYYQQTLKAWCWFLKANENTKAKPLVAIMCFSDDTWWTKAEEMKAFCLPSAES